jgi:hypothetical protein
MASSIQISERRTEYLLKDLLVSQGWDPRHPPQGDLILQNEYRGYPELSEALSKSSKSGKGYGIPEAILVDRASTKPLAVIEAKGSILESDKAISEAQTYANALWDSGWGPLAIGLAGTSDHEFRLRVSKRVSSSRWEPVTYEGHPIGWIPTKTDLQRVATPRASLDIRPTVPPLEVLAARAEEINRLLRESRIQDGQRPAVVGAIMLALWHSKGEVRRDSSVILRDINSACRDAFVAAGKPELAKSLRVDEANFKLREKARRIATILERLNITVLTAEHDYLGQLYEAFFRYTGGNSIGQYFTPRHITQMMVDVCEVTKQDIVLDPACGTGGFLISCMDRLIRKQHLSRAEVIRIVPTHLIGFEDEPVTAALCVANMILRGDGKTGIHKADCFSSDEFPLCRATVALMNPPFPHEKTDDPSEKYVDRALEGLRDRGKLAVILPTGILVKPGTTSWRNSILEKNSLLAVCQLPDELFQPFASATTSFVLIEKGVPHNPRRKTAFVRLRYDGLSLEKGARIERGPNQIQDALDAIANGTLEAGFSGTANIREGMEWAAGAYIESAPPDTEELMGATDVLIRRLASFYTRYAPEVLAQRQAIASGEITEVDYRNYVSAAKKKNSSEIVGAEDEIGGRFDIYYGLGEIESREGMQPGRTLIISPTEQYNGCDGWLEFNTVLRPPFITVARTGSIGEAFVHLEPCAPNSDCLVLLPRTKEWAEIPELILAASAIRLEKWRFNYGRKITPSRIARMRIPVSGELKEYVAELYRKFESVIEASLEPYQDTQFDRLDIDTARIRITEIKANPQLLISGTDLDKKLDELLA